MRISQHRGGGLLRTDPPYSVGTVFAYTPIVRPEAPSILRQIAYLENTALLGPEEDPEGWTTLMPIKIRGTIFHARELDVTCTVSIEVSGATIILNFAIRFDS